MAGEGSFCLEKLSDYSGITGSLRQKALSFISTCCTGGVLPAKIDRNVGDLGVNYIVLGTTRTTDGKSEVA
jgi:hypothetical protein